MIGVSDRFKETLKRGHVVRQRAEILADGEVQVVIDGVTTYDSVTGARTSTVGGNVSVARALVQRSGTAEFLDLDGYLTPTEAGDLLAPMRNEVRLYRGVELWDATPGEITAGTHVEYCPIGTLIINKVSGRYPKKVVTGYDRMSTFRGRFEDTYTIQNGTNTVDAFEQLVRARFPANRVDMALPTLGYTTPLVVKAEQEDPGQLAQDLASSCGYVAYCDPMGQITWAPEPIVDSESIAWTFDPSDQYNIGRQPERDLDASDAYNVVVTRALSNDGVTLPIRGYAEDTNPRSFTYVWKVGRYPYFFSSPLLGGPGQAQLAANTILLRELGLSDTTVINSHCNPAFESGDVIYAVDPLQNLADFLLLDEFEVPLGAAGEQTLSTRAQVV